MKTPTSTQMAYLSGKIKAWAIILMKDKTDINISNVIDGMDKCSQEIAEEFTSVDVERYYDTSTK